MSKQWFKRLLLSYLPIFFIITSLLLAISILAVSSLSQRATEEANIASAKHAMALLDNSLKAVDDAILKEIQSNPVLGQFFYPPSGGIRFIRFTSPRPCFAISLPECRASASTPFTFTGRRIKWC
ncbi:hypothetical protein N6H14_05565 [Paenibacillus sp. CC-CFT747]|nr:hypothetical protein N6H14_05565 [Paenibacillus sp. CC-CFT747]